MEKVTYYNLSNYLNTLNPILDKVTGKLGFVVARNHRIIEKEVKAYREKIEEIIKKYGDTDEEAQVIRVSDPEKAKKADKEYVGISNLAISVDILKINEEDLADADLTAKEMLSLSWMIEYPEDKKPEHKEIEKGPAAKANEELPGDADRFGL